MPPKKTPAADTETPAPQKKKKPEGVPSLRQEPKRETGTLKKKRLREAASS
jgi:hypothetical protein